MTSSFDAFKNLFPNLAESTAFAIFIAVYIGLVFVIYLLYCFAAWRIFTKMGEKGWKSLIPIYNLYILTKCVAKKKLFLPIFLLYVVMFAASLTNSFFSYSKAEGAVVTICSIIYAAASIALFVLNIILAHKVSKAFGHGAGFTVGLIFLTFIFELILAFGSSQYVGTPDSD